ncbi:hypothetical protein AAFF_G00206160 [Aldrovandia affinis]|uniref:Transmembrane and coiled-coil domain family 3 n=1 Tax=Aldrovandia affinis TaxID=143900 RepID=A0AAD7RHQ1_9TELE|nr:hypothetical protein AAFF_G00206160 [Aldrovandia affinis]
MPSADTALDTTLLEVKKYYHRNEMADRNGDGYVLSIPVPMRRGGSETSLDLHSTTGGGLGAWAWKILKVTEQLKIEQTARDENVAEYLKLVTSADKQQAARIKQVFEKKNQKSAQSIAQLQKKLEQYHKRMKDNESNGSSSRGPDPPARPRIARVRQPHPQQVRQRRQHRAPEELAGPGSSFQQEGGGRALSGSATIVGKAKYPSDDECSSGTSVSADSNGTATATGAGTRPAAPRPRGSWPLLLEEVREIREAQNQLAEDMEGLKEQFKRDYGFITQTIQEERYRYERLEDQLNDLTELHQHETTNLKQELASIEEKVAYQAYERARDIQEALESSQTRIAKLELQQQQQQVVQGESTDAKALLGKCINVMLAIVTVILVCVSTVARFTTPLMRSRLHVVCTFFGVTLLAVFWRNWEHLQVALERMLTTS